MQEDDFKLNIKDCPKKFLNSFEELPEEINKTIFSFYKDNLLYDFVLAKKPINKLFVFFSGKINREKPINPPVFQRWLWAEEFPGSCLYIADPACYLSKGCQGSFYVGTEKSNVMDGVEVIIREISKRLQVEEKNIITYGSSAGGYASIMNLRKFPLATSIVINIQTSLITDSMIAKEFKDKIDKNLDRLDLNCHFEFFKKCKIIYFQNLLDHHYHKTYYEPFLKKYDLNKSNNYQINNIKAVTFTKEGGHNAAEGRERIPFILDHLNSIFHKETLHAT